MYSYFINSLKNSLLEVKLPYEPKAWDILLLWTYLSTWLNWLAELSAQDKLDNVKENLR